MIRTCPMILQMAKMKQGQVKYNILSFHREYINKTTTRLISYGKQTLNTIKILPSYHNRKVSYRCMFIPIGLTLYVSLAARSGKISKSVYYRPICAYTNKSESIKERLIVCCLTSDPNLFFPIRMEMSPLAVHEKAANFGPFV